MDRRKNIFQKISRIKVKKQFVFNLANYNSFDEALNDLIDRVSVSRRADLSAYITTYTYPSKDLSAEMTAGGLCLMKWNRNSNNYSTTFIIEAGNKTTDKWEIIGTSTKSQYEAKLPNTLGNNLFRVKAQKGTNISEASNVILI